MDVYVIVLFLSQDNFLIWWTHRHAFIRQAEIFFLWFVLTLTERWDVAERENPDFSLPTEGRLSSVHTCQKRIDFVRSSRNSTRNRRRSFSPSLDETINTSMIVFGAAAFTRPLEQEVVQVPEEKEVSNKNINSHNCYETTTTTRVVASLFRESFSDVCIYDCCIFVYHILLSYVCVGGMSTRRVSWLTITIHILVDVRLCIWVEVCSDSLSLEERWDVDSDHHYSFHSMTCVMRALSTAYRERLRRMVTSVRHSPRRMLNRMQCLEYDRKSVTPLTQLAYYRNLDVSMRARVCIRAHNKNLLSALSLSDDIFTMRSSFVI